MTALYVISKCLECVDKTAPKVHIRRMDVFDKLFKAIPGGVTAAARALDIEPSAVTNWRRRGQIPANRVIELEKLSKSTVTRYEMRPDIYPPED